MLQGVLQGSMGGGVVGVIRGTSWGKPMGWVLV